MAQRGQRARKGKPVPLVESQAAQAGQACQRGQRWNLQHVSTICDGEAAQP